MVSQSDNMTSLIPSTLSLIGYDYDYDCDYYQ